MGDRKPKGMGVLTAVVVAAVLAPGMGLGADPPGQAKKPHASEAKHHDKTPGPGQRTDAPARSSGAMTPAPSGVTLYPSLPWVSLPAQPYPPTTRSVLPTPPARSGGCTRPGGFILYPSTTLSVLPAVESPAASASALGASSVQEDAAALGLPGPALSATLATIEGAWIGARPGELSGCLPDAGAVLLVGCGGAGRMLSPAEFLSAASRTMQGGTTLSLRFDEQRTVSGGMVRAAGTHTWRDAAGAQRVQSAAVLLRSLGARWVIAAADFGRP